MRKVIQVIATKYGSMAGLVVLCNDGTLWASSPEGWSELETPPQPEKESNECPAVSSPP